MAIVQISRITNRKGLTENLPQLSGAELGWCIDSRRLFIGNGTLEQGAPVVGNTEILTEYSDITVLSNYTYQDVVVGYAAQTGPTPSDPTVRSVQAKLDDFASVRDFGAVGDGVADDTEAINRALYQLYCRDNNTQIRRSLFFPAGTYRVSSTILIPTYAKLVGEGANCSTILMSPNDSSIPTYVARYCDSKQQTGATIGNNGAVAPRNIEISSMTFQSVTESNTFLIDRATQCWFDSVNFVGPYSIDDVENSGSVPIDSVSTVSFAGSGSLIPNNITFDKCQFSNSYYGFDVAQAIETIDITNCQFEILVQGIVVGVSTVTGLKALHNMFDNVYSEAIDFGTSSLNVSGYNIFYNVGNSIGAGSPVTSIIKFNADNNLSINDLFERSQAESYNVPRISINITGSANGCTQITQGRFTVESGRTFTLANNQTNQTIYQINSDNQKAFNMQYTIERGTTTRTGVLSVVPTQGASTVSYCDDYTETSSTGVTLSVAKSGATVNVRYSSTNTGTAGTLTYSLNYLA